MNTLTAGMVLFIAVHLVPSLPGAREKLIGMLGLKRYRLVFALSSFAALALIVGGKAAAPFVPLWRPPAWGADAAMPLMLAAMAGFAATGLPTNLKRVTRHPMLWGVALWSAAHLLSNGDLASAVLFGGFGLFALFAMFSLNRRGADFGGKQPFSKDLTVALLGFILFALAGLAHPFLFSAGVF
ncbi:MAG: NnrU family protein [Gammaproteobacteria bacterium]|nr:NnrU family protein [Gammaproteobacteria bacterium]MDD9850997.1 NnrU family protein [Gammaproteobacteria bacterium]MDD9870962.1 NnrU family protein [Gammaproteobacteria bacterium]